MNSNMVAMGVSELTKIVKELLLAAEVPTDEAAIITDSMIEADLRGISSHGVMRLPIYLKRLKAGSVKSKSETETIVETNNILLLDGKHSMGQVLGVQAMKKAIEKAEKNDVGIVGVKNSHHFGIAAYFSSIALQHDMIGITISNTTPLMPAIGGAEAVVGNNPFSFAIPAMDQKPIIFDMACSVVAMGKIINAQNKGESIPENWGVNHKGLPTSSPEEILSGGFISAVGGPKGFGLALVVDILCGVLLGGAYGKDVKSIYKEISEPNACGHLFIAIKINSFMLVDFFKRTVDQYITQIKSSQKAEGVSEIYLPGELELFKKERLLKEGIMLPKKVYEELLQLFEEYRTTI